MCPTGKRGWGYPSLARINFSKCNHLNEVSLCRIGIFSCGLILVTVGVFFNLSWNNILEYTIKNDLELSSSSKSYRIWIENSVPLNIDFYFFNWTNPSDLKQPGYKPQLEEVGPFRFREHIKKIVLNWNTNKTVTYKKRRRWYFQANESKGSLDDEITTLNIIALTAAHRTRYWSRMVRIPLSAMLSATQKISTTKKVRQFLFEGFPDPLIEFASKVPGFSSQVPFDKFGWFYRRNDSSEFDGVFNMETGGNGFDVMGQLKFWNYQNHTSFYEGECGDVRGSAGDFWPPERNTKEDLVLFSPDMCRYVSFAFNEEENIGNLKGYKYVSGAKLFDNGTLDSRNRCFCGGKCIPSGLVNVSSCRFGAPAFVSYPHFYLADSSYRESVGGMKPNPKKHDMYIVLEQRWGIPLEVAIRLQVNVLLEPDSGIRMLDRVSSTFFPMLWFDQKVIITKDMKREVEMLLELPKLGFILSIALYLVGSSFIAYFVLFEFFFAKKNIATS